MAGKTFKASLTNLLGVELPFESTIPFLGIGKHKDDDADSEKFFIEYSEYSIVGYTLRFHSNTANDALSTDFELNLRLPLLPVTPLVAAGFSNTGNYTATGLTITTPMIPVFMLNFYRKFYEDRVTDNTSLAIVLPFM